MGEWKWERIAALTGVAEAALIAVRTLTTPSPAPAFADSTTDWYAANQGRWMFAVWLTGVIVVAGTWFHGGLRSYLSRQGAARLAGIGFAGWIFVAVIALIRHAILAVPSLTIQPESVFEGISSFTGPLALATAGVMLAMVWFGAFITAVAVAIAGARFKALPWWFNFLTAVEAVILGVGTLQLVFVAGGYFSLSGDFRWVVLWSYVVWTAVGGLVLYSRLGEEA